jgi:hypothetical protein
MPREVSKAFKPFMVHFRTNNVARKTTMAKSKTDETEKTAADNERASYWGSVGIAPVADDIDARLAALQKAKPTDFVRQEDDFHQWPEVPDAKDASKNTLEGIFLGGEVSNRGRVVFAMARKDKVTGKTTTTRFLGTQILTRAMKNVAVGDPCRIVFVGTKESGKGNDLKVFEVYTVKA